MITAHTFGGIPTSTMNDCVLTQPLRTQISEQEYNDLTASNRRQLTLYSSTTPHFPEEPGHMLFRGSQNMCRRLWHTPNISQ